MRRARVWQKIDYWIYYCDENSDWDQVNFVFGPRQFDDEDRTKRQW